MSTVHYAKATVVRVSALALNALGTFFLFPFILHRIGEHDFGIWSIAASITGYMMLIDFGVSLACTRFLALSIGDKREWQRIMTNAVALSLVIMVVLVLSGLVLIALQSIGINIFSDRSLGFVVGVLAIETGVSMVLRVYQSILRADLNYIYLGLFEIVRVLLRLVGIPLILINGGGLIHLVMYSALVNVFFFFCSYIYVRVVHKQSYFSRKWFDFSVIKALFNFGKMAIIVQAVDLFRYRLDGIFIGFSMGISAIAQYAILITAVDMAMQILSRFLSYWETIIIRQIGTEDDTSLEYMFHSMTIGFWISALFIGNFYLFGEIFLSIWVGEQYTHLSDELTLLSCLLLLATFQMSISPYLNGHGRQKTDAILALGEVTMKVLFAIPMIQQFGFKGLMVTTLATGLLVNIAGRLSVVADISGLSYSALLIRLIKKTMPLILTILLLMILWKIVYSLRLEPLTGKILMLVVQFIAMSYLLHYKFSQR